MFIRTFLFLFIDTAFFSADSVQTKFGHPAFQDTQRKMTRRGGEFRIRTADNSEPSFELHNSSAHQIV